MTKSAQFPFHTWLPETMEARRPPSPPSCTRGSSTPAATSSSGSAPWLRNRRWRWTCSSSTGLTATLGSVVMLTQTDVKRSLAYSTVSQMGFMMMQCGLGRVLRRRAAHRRPRPVQGPRLPRRGGGARPAGQGARPVGRTRRAVRLLRPGGLGRDGGFGPARGGGGCLDEAGRGGHRDVPRRGRLDARLPRPHRPRFRPAHRSLVASAGLPLVLGYLGAWKLLDACAGPLPGPVALPVAAVGLPPRLIPRRGGRRGRGAFHGLGRPAARGHPGLGRRLYVLALNGFHVADLLRLPFAARSAGPASPGQRAA